MRDYAHRYLNQSIDVSEEFSKEENRFFLGTRVEDFDPDSASGSLRWERYDLRHRMSFNQLTPILKRTVGSVGGSPSKKTGSPKSFR